MNQQAMLEIILASQQQSKSLEDCYMEGYWMSQKEMDETVNPFSEGSQEHEFWMNGFHDHIDGQMPLFPDHSFAPMINQERDQLETARVDKRRFKRWELALCSFGALVAGLSVYSAVLDMAA